MVFLVALSEYACAEIVLIMGQEEGETTSGVTFYIISFDLSTNLIWKWLLNPFDLFDIFLIYSWKVDWNSILRFMILTIIAVVDLLGAKCLSLYLIKGRDRHLDYASILYLHSKLFWERYLYSVIRQLFWWKRIDYQVTCLDYTFLVNELVSSYWRLA